MNAKFHTPSTLEQKKLINSQLSSRESPRNSKSLNRMTTRTALLTLKLESEDLLMRWFQNLLDLKMTRKISINSRKELLINTLKRISLTLKMLQSSKKSENINSKSMTLTGD